MILSAIVKESRHGKHLLEILGSLTHLPYKTKYNTGLFSYITLLCPTPRSGLYLHACLGIRGLGPDVPLHPHAGDGARKDVPEWSRYKGSFLPSFVNLSSRP